jgi:ATP-dependent DNA helicase RecQ
MLDPLFVKGLALMRQALAHANAEFRPDQWEAIHAVAARRARLLVVQRTGWGKSLVYFLATRLLRDQGAGPTLIVSPLLALMRNQIAAAQRMGVKAVTVNSANHQEWREVHERIHADRVDALLISPERLANDEFRDHFLMPVAGRVGLLVVDEAHCISDWGHDFRPDYHRITRILQALPPGVAVVATTATANNRVVDDIKAQLGGPLTVLRGPLLRESLRLHKIVLPNETSKMAWLAHHLPRFPGSGIIYVLTIRSAERVADWLQTRGIAAAAYSAGLEHGERLQLEDDLLANRLKALVATTALGMGFDKPDLGFVVHFHEPASVVHYYQQVGRAGRAVERAYGVLLAGGEDHEITDWFISTAFPPQEHVEQIVEALDTMQDGATLRELEPMVNLAFTEMEKALKMLAVESPSPVLQRGNRWYTTAVKYRPELLRQKAEQQTAIRLRERQRMDDYVRSETCLMEFLARELDDPQAGPCGKCTACQRKLDVMLEAPEDVERDAMAYLRCSALTLKPRKQWPAGAMPVYGWSGKIDERLRAEPGRALSVLKDGGWGHLVYCAKYREGRLDDVLVAAAVQLVEHWKPQPFPGWVTCVPSAKHPNLVPDFARRLAARLRLPFMAPMAKVRPTRPQKDFNNSWQQVRNLDGAFRVTPGPGLGGVVLLIDDVCDSGWTFTVAAALLRQAGSGRVFPLALAVLR